MSKIDVRNINLNLLPALEALLREGSVTAAARRMHVSQSAMSHSLTKLRELFADPLLVRNGRRLVPTARARALRARLPTCLDQLSASLAGPERFDPARSTRTFRLLTVDQFDLTTLPRLLTLLRQQAPSVNLEVERASADLRALAAGEFHLALTGAHGARPHASALRHREILQDPFAVLVRDGHPRLKKRLTLATYLALGHVLVSLEGQREGVVDRALAALGHTRRVALRVAHFSAAPLAVMESDLICTISRQVALRARDLYGLRVLTPPLQLPATRVFAVWPAHHEDDAGANWFRRTVVETLSESRAR